MKKFKVLMYICTLDQPVLILSSRVIDYGSKTYCFDLVHEGKFMKNEGQFILNGSFVLSLLEVSK